MHGRFTVPALLAALIAGAVLAPPASAQSLFSLFAPPAPAQIAPDVPAIEAVPAEDPVAREAPLPARLARHVVDYPSREAPGTIIVDTPHTTLYLVLGGGKAMRYGIGVGREGFTWSGAHAIVRKAEWPDWYPPPTMIRRQPYLPRMVAGGPGNPLGARALYIGGTEYRIHGTNDPSSIGKFVSSGCIRLTNADVKDLYERVKVGAKVIVLPMTREARAPAREADEAQASAYAPVAASGGPHAFRRIRPSGLY
jgi:lipoprotein-anchoring transpeptidase ErfK/SrfK